MRSTAAAAAVAPLATVAGVVATLPVEEADDVPADAAEQPVRAGAALEQVVAVDAQQGVAATTAGEPAGGTPRRCRDVVVALATRMSRDPCCPRRQPLDTAPGRVTSLAFVPTPPLLADVVAVLDGWYPPSWAEPWDAVGTVCGDPAEPVRRVLLAVDPVHEVVAEAVEWGADLLVVHHPLLLKAVHSVAADTPKGRIVHTLVRGTSACTCATPTPTRHPAGSARHWRMCSG